MTTRRAAESVSLLELAIATRRRSPSAHRPAARAPQGRAHAGGDARREEPRRAGRGGRRSGRRNRLPAARPGPVGRTSRRLGARRSGHRRRRSRRCRRGAGPPGRQEPETPTARSRDGPRAAKGRRMDSQRSVDIDRLRRDIEATRASISRTAGELRWKAGEAMQWQTYVERYPVPDPGGGRPGRGRPRPSIARGLDRGPAEDGNGRPWTSAAAGMDSVSRLPARLEPHSDQPRGDHRLVAEARLAHRRAGEPHHRRRRRRGGASARARPRRRRRGLPRRQGRAAGVPTGARRDRTSDPGMGEGSST